MTTHTSLLQEEILKLKEERRAIILAHNYQRDEVQGMADFVGDSLELSRTASTIDCEVIVFAGVNFMAESASILSPYKTVLLPEIEAGCPMADMIHVDSPRIERKKFPGFHNPPPFTYPHEFISCDLTPAERLDIRVVLSSSRATFFGDLFGGVQTMNLEEESRQSISFCP